MAEVTSCIFNFYSDPVFDENKNGAYENMYAYMQAHTPTYTTEYKFVRPALKVTLKLPVSSHIRKYTLGNYCCQSYHTATLTDIQPNVNAYAFYYVTKLNWKGKETLEVELTLDTLTTYFAGAGGNFHTANFSAESHITRKFKDRWVYDSVSEKFLPLVDRGDEQFGTLPMVKQRKALPYGDTYHGGETVQSQHWYLIYRSQYESEDKVKTNPVSVIAFPEVSTKISNAAAGDVTWTADSISLNTNYAIANARNSGERLIANSASGTAYDITIGQTTVSGTNNPVIAARIYKFLSDDGATINFIFAYKNKNGTLGSFAISSVVFKTIKTVFRQTETAYGSWTFDDIEYYSPIAINAGASIVTLTTFDAWYKNNKTDSRLVKIRQLPTAPFWVSLDETGTSISKPSKWKINSELGLEFTGTGFEGCYTTIKLAENFAVLEPNEVQQGGSVPKKKYETKLLYNSNFHTIKFVYDSNVYPIHLENWADAQTTGIASSENSTNIFFYVSDGMDDGLLWSFGNNETYDTDFGNAFYVSKSTDIPYFNSEYLNYLRYGKSVDTRNANTTIAGAIVSGIGTGLSTAASAAFAASQMSSAAMGPVGIAATLAVSVATTAITIGSTCAKAYDSINSKIDQYTHQAATVNAGSDVSLFKKYGGNKLYLFEYKPRDDIEDSLYNYFRLYGYSCDEYGKPTCTRRYVDYFKGEFQFTPEFNRSHDQDIIDDAKARMAVGFRVYHYIDGTFDTDFEKENWETSVWSKVNS